jgi:hypothetical protein
MPFVPATATCHLGRATIEALVRLWVALPQFLARASIKSAAAAGRREAGFCTRAGTPRWDRGWSVAQDANLQPCRWGDPTVPTGANADVDLGLRK